MKFIIEGQRSLSLPKEITQQDVNIIEPAIQAVNQSDLGFQLSPRVNPRKGENYSLVFEITGQQPEKSFFLANDTFWSTVRALKFYMEDISDYIQWKKTQNNS